MAGFRWTIPGIVWLTLLILVPVLAVACGESATPTAEPVATQAPDGNGGSHSHRSARSHRRPGGNADSRRDHGHPRPRRLPARRWRRPCPQATQSPSESPVMQPAHAPSFSEYWQPHARFLRRANLRRASSHQLRRPSGPRQHLGRLFGRNGPGCASRRITTWWRTNPTTPAKSSPTWQGAGPTTTTPPA